MQSGFNDNQSKYIEYLPEPLISSIKSGKAVPFIGAGFSKNANIKEGLVMPSWDELGRVIASRIPDYEYKDVIDALSCYAWKFSKEDLIKEIRNTLNIGQVKPGILHKELIRIFSNSDICTTNYDTLLEDTAGVLSLDIPAVCSEDGITTYSDYAQKIIKIHGDINLPASMVVTERDYDEFLDKNPLLVAYLANIFLTKNVVFIGYSLDDPDLRSIFHLVKSRLGNFAKPAYCIIVNGNNSEVLRYNRRYVNPINIQSEESTYKDVLTELFKELAELLGRKEENNYNQSYDLIMNNYIGKTFTGKDPWGDIFSVALNEYSEKILDWKWNNIVDVNGKQQLIDIEIKTELNNNYVGEYYFRKQLYIYEDEEAYFNYTYGGTIQLIDNKVLITFNHGYCCSYLLGGSGAEGYYYSGGWRNAANLLAILDNDSIKNIEYKNA